MSVAVGLLRSVGKVVAVRIAVRACSIVEVALGMVVANVVDDPLGLVEVDRGPRG